MNKEEKKVYQRDLMRKRRAKLTESNIPADSNSRLTALEERVTLLEQVISDLASAQAKVSVVKGNTIYANPLSKDAQASLKAMPYMNRGN